MSGHPGLGSLSNGAPSISLPAAERLVQS